MLKYKDQTFEFGYVFLHNSSSIHNHHGSHFYKRLSSSHDQNGSKLLLLENTRNEVNVCKCSFWRRSLPEFCSSWVVAGQLIMSSILWNYNLFIYSDIFDAEVNQSHVQEDALKSSTMWMVIYFWRLFNPHSIVQYVLIAILYNRTFEYFVSMQFLGYLPICFIALLSHIYAELIRSQVEF